MTLVVSDISNLGIIMVGDSALTRKWNGHADFLDGAAKIQYSEEANVGFAMWGSWDVGNTKMDHWIQQFLADSVTKGHSVEAVGERLALALNDELKQAGKPWHKLRRGIHVGGYQNGLPCLFHVHCGHEGEPSHELRLYKDFPDYQKYSQEYFEKLLQSGVAQLRNGYHTLFAPLFVGMIEYSQRLQKMYRISFPQKTLESRFEFYKLLVKFVAGTLKVSGLDPGVNDTLSAIAFREDGIVIDERLPMHPGDPSGLDAQVAEFFG